MSTEHQERWDPWPVRLTGRRGDRELKIVPIEPRIFAGFFALLILEPFVECGSRLVYLQVAGVHLVVFAIRREKFGIAANFVDGRPAIWRLAGLEAMERQLGVAQSSAFAE